jgi:hypothetical protein
LSPTTVLAAGQGSYSLSGQAALFKLTEVAAQGSYSLSGQTATLADDTPSFWTVEYHNGSEFVDITDDVMPGMRWDGGITGNGPFDRVAAPGSFEFQMKNGQNNSAGLVGYYSPDHANKRSGWALGAKVRITLDDGGGNTLVWTYYIKSIMPMPGPLSERRVEVIAKDYIEEFSKRKTSGLTVQTNKLGNELVTIVVDSMPIAPDAESFFTGSSNFRYAFHSERDEETSFLTVLQKISQSELSYIYVRPSDSGGSTLVYLPHTIRQNNYTSLATLSDTMTDLEIEHSVDSIFNKARVTVFPVEIDTELSEVASIGEEISIEPMSSITLFLPYKDPDSEQRISAINVVTPVHATDWLFSTISGSQIGDLGANFTIDDTATANSVILTLGNTSSFKGYLFPLRVRGFAVRIFDKVEMVASDSTSIDTYGERTLSINLPYQNNIAFGEAVADEILRRWKDPLSQISGVTFVTSSSALMTHAMTLTISDRITIEETVSGVSDDFFINGFEYELITQDKLRVRWTLERAWNDTRYFTVGDPTYGVIGGAYEIAPF